LAATTTHRSHLAFDRCAATISLIRVWRLVKLCHASQPAPTPVFRVSRSMGVQPLLPLIRFSLPMSASTQGVATTSHLDCLLDKGISQY